MEKGGCMRVGYARVSMDNPSVDIQLKALAAADCEKVYQDKGSSRGIERKGLAACLKALQSGDTLVVWRLDRMGGLLKTLFGWLKI
jgi:DNA invertase Pin-like site-specific DNA recombinase